MTKNKFFIIGVFAALLLTALYITWKKAQAADLEYSRIYKTGK